MSATDELRRMLDERGVEYFKHEDGEPLRKLEKADEPVTSWHMGGASVCAVPIEGSDLFDLWIDHCTPEQAIAATLGGGTLTAEQVREAIFGNSSYASYDGAKYYADGIGMQAIADELNTRAERTCHDKSTGKLSLFWCSECDAAMDGFIDVSGHPRVVRFCPYCGAKVVDK